MMWRRVSRGQYRGVQQLPIQEPVNNLDLLKFKIATLSLLICASDKESPRGGEVVETSHTRNGKKIFTNRVAGRFFPKEKDPLQEVSAALKEVDKKLSELAGEIPLSEEDLKTASKDPKKKQAFKEKFSLAMASLQEKMPAAPKELLSSLGNALKNIPAKLSEVKNTVVSETGKFLESKGLTGENLLIAVECAVLVGVVAWTLASWAAIGAGAIEFLMTGKAAAMLGAIQHSILLTVISPILATHVGSDIREHVMSKPPKSQPQDA